MLTNAILVVALCSAVSQAIQLPMKIDLSRLSSAMPKQLTDMFAKDPKKHPEPSPKKDFKRWEAEGIYAIRVSQPQHHGESPQESDEDFNAQNLRMYGFYKIVDGHSKKFRIDAYPISTPEMTPDPMEQKSSAKRTYQGPLVLLGDGEHVYLVKERLKECEEADEFGCNSVGDNDISCSRIKMQIESPEPLKHATYRGLTFEHNTLCHRYENITISEKKQQHEGRDVCEVRNSELYLDAFTHHPVELHIEGKLHHRQDQSHRRFLVHIFFNAFEFDVDQRDEKELLSWPATLREVCQEEEISDLDGDSLGFLQAAGLFQQ